jgi:biopolymer transport protein ExbD
MPRLRKPKIEDLNLIPLMNLFVTMIPLLLLTAAFYHIGMVSVSVPTQDPGGEQSSVEEGETAVTVNIQISDKGYTVTASSATLSEETLRELDASIPKRSDGTYDFAKLTAALERIKRRYEKSETIVVVPDKNIAYQDMIETMDAARNMEVKVGGKKRKIALFPVVVVSSIVE